MTNNSPNSANMFDSFGPLLTRTIHVCASNSTSSRSKQLTHQVWNGSDEQLKSLKNTLTLTFFFRAWKKTRGRWWCSSLLWQLFSRLFFSLACFFLDAKLFLLFFFTIISHWSDFFCSAFFDNLEMERKRPLLSGVLPVEQRSQPAIVYSQQEALISLIFWRNFYERDVAGDELEEKGGREI